MSTASQSRHAAAGAVFAAHFLLTVTDGVATVT